LKSLAVVSRNADLTSSDNIDSESSTKPSVSGGGSQLIGDPNAYATKKLDELGSEVESSMNSHPSLPLFFLWQIGDDKKYDEWLKTNNLVDSKLWRLLKGTRSQKVIDFRNVLPEKSKFKPKDRNLPSVVTFFSMVTIEMAIKKASGKVYIYIEDGEPFEKLEDYMKLIPQKDGPDYAHKPKNLFSYVLGILQDPQYNRKIEIIRVSSKSKWDKNKKEIVDEKAIWTTGDTVTMDNIRPSNLWLQFSRYFGAPQLSR